MKIIQGGGRYIFNIPYYYTGSRCKDPGGKSNTCVIGTECPQCNGKTGIPAIVFQLCAIHSPHDPLSALDSDITADINIVIGGKITRDTATATNIQLVCWICIADTKISVRKQGHLG